MIDQSGGERAGAVSRLGAFFADAVIIAVTLRTTAWLFAGTARALGRFAPPIDVGKLLLAAAPLLIAIYNVAFWLTLGGTPGKLLMGIRVVSTQGLRLGFGRALLRLVGYLLSALPFYIGYLWILGPKRRGWHDILARTEVVYARRRQPAPSRPVRYHQRIDELRTAS